VLTGYYQIQLEIAEFFRPTLVWGPRSGGSP